MKSKGVIKLKKRVVITALLVSSGMLMTFDIPAWVILTSALAIGLGTVSYTHLTLPTNREV